MAWLNNKEGKSPGKENKGRSKNRSENFSSTALLAIPVYIGQDQGEDKKRIKRGAKIEPGPLFSSRLLSRPVLTPGRCIFLCLPNKTEL